MFIVFIFFNIFSIKNNYIYIDIVIFYNIDAITLSKAVILETTKASTINNAIILFLFFCFRLLLLIPSLHYSYLLRLLLYLSSIIKVLMLELYLYFSIKTLYCHLNYFDTSSSNSLTKELNLSIVFSIGFVLVKSTPQSFKTSIG